MKVLTGIVIRTNNAKTAHVEVKTEWMHPKYLKKIRKTKIFASQDDTGVHIGDEVEIEECRPISATKHFKVRKVTKKAVVHETKKVVEKPKVKGKKVASSATRRRGGK